MSDLKRLYDSIPLGYKLVNKKPQPVYSMIGWAGAFEKMNRRVALTEFRDGISVSTVFLALDHNFSRVGPPVLFETMIFGGKHNQYQERYCTWKEAEKGHLRAVELVLSTGVKLEDRLTDDR